MKYLILFIMLFSCSQPNHKLGHTTPRLLELIADFESDFDLKVDFPVLFVESFSESKPAGVAGFCRVTFNYRFVEMLSIYEKAPYLNALVYHELGHCALNLKHYEAETDIMNAIFPTTNFPFYRQKMIDNFYNYVYE